MMKKTSTVRGHTPKANSQHGLTEVLRETTKLWRKHHLSYDQSRYVVAQVRSALQLVAPRERRRTVLTFPYVDVNPQPHGFLSITP